MTGWLGKRTVNVRAMLAAAVALVLLGCNQETDRLPLSGTVNWQGLPLAKGSILFVPTKDHRGPKIGAAIVNGEYQIDKVRGATSGAYRVEVRVDTGEYPHSPTDRQPPTKTPAPQQIPAEYNTRSRLTAVVSADQTRFDFELPLATR
jgi:hypothetical protein